MWLVDEEPRIVNLGSTTMRMLKALYDQSFEFAAECGIVLPDQAFVFSDEPDGRFRQVDYGSYSEHACAVEKNGESIQCWGTNNTYGQQDVPPGLD